MYFITVPHFTVWNAKKAFAQTPVFARVLNPEFR